MCAVLSTRTVLSFEKEHFIVRNPLSQTAGYLVDTPALPSNDPTHCHCNKQIFLGLGITHY